MLSRGVVFYRGYGILFIGVVRQPIVEMVKNAIPHGLVFSAL